MEALIALGMLVGLALVAMALFMVAPGKLIAVGSALTILGVLVGFPAGAWYHVRLRRALRPVPPGWYWRPTSYHDRIPDAERPRVMRWFYVGGVSFMVILVGCGLALVGALRR